MSIFLRTGGEVRYVFKLCLPLGVRAFVHGYFTNVVLESVVDKIL